MIQAFFIGLFAFGMGVWTLLVLYFSPLLPAGWRGIAMVLFALLLALLMVSSRRWVLVPAAILFIGVVVSALFLKLEPKEQADWRPEVSRPPVVKFDGDRIALSHVRDFRFRDGKVTEQRYLDRDIDLSQLTGVDFLISYWDEERAVAHTMMSFQFEGEEALCISVEARREAGEDWNVLPGLFRQFELFYVVGTERDLIGQRIHDRGERVYRFRTELSPMDGRLFLSNVLHAAEDLRHKPVWYQTLSNNCTTTLVHHLNEIWPDRAPYEKRLWLNGYTPQHAWDAGLIASEAPFEEYVASSEVLGEELEH